MGGVVGLGVSAKANRESPTNATSSNPYKKLLFTLLPLFLFQTALTIEPFPDTMTTELSSFQGKGWRYGNQTPYTLYSQYYGGGYRLKASYTYRSVCL